MYTHSESSSGLDEIKQKRINSRNSEIMDEIENLYEEVYRERTYKITKTVNNKLIHRNYGNLKNQDWKKHSQTSFSPQNKTSHFPSPPTQKNPKNPKNAKNAKNSKNANKPLKEREENASCKKTSSLEEENLFELCKMHKLRGFRRSVKECTKLNSFEREKLVDTCSSSDEDFTEYDMYFTKRKANKNTKLAFTNFMIYKSLFCTHQRSCMQNLVVGGFKHFFKGLCAAGIGYLIHTLLMNKNINKCLIIYRKRILQLAFMNSLFSVIYYFSICISRSFGFLHKKITSVAAAVFISFFILIFKKDVRKICSLLSMSVVAGIALKKLKERISLNTKFDNYLVKKKRIKKKKWIDLILSHLSFILVTMFIHLVSFLDIRKRQKKQFYFQRYFDNIMGIKKDSNEQFLYFKYPNIQNIKKDLL